jgi:tetratricopeptide (TPR) repeat protein
MEARLELAAFLQAQGLLDEAVAAYRTALESGPDARRRQIGARLAGALLASGPTAGLEGEVETLLTDAPDDDAVAARQLAWLRLKARRAAEALAGFERVLALRPDDARAKRGRALACLALDRLDEGVAAFDDAPKRK